MRLTFVAISAITLIALYSPQASAASRTRAYNAETKSYSCAGPMCETPAGKPGERQSTEQYPYKQTVPPKK